jgi:hypothetical protein
LKFLRRDMAASPSTESQAEEQGWVGQGRPGRCWPRRVRHGRGGLGSAVAGEAPARAEGGLGSGMTGVGQGRAWLGRCRSGGVGRGGWGTLGRVRGQAWPGWGWGQAPPMRGRVRRQREEQLVAAAARVAARGRDAREREAGERKGGAGYARLCSSGRHISRWT